MIARVPEPLPEERRTLVLHGFEDVHDLQKAKEGLALLLDGLTDIAEGAFGGSLEIGDITTNLDGTRSVELIVKEHSTQFPWALIEKTLGGAFE